MGVNIGLYRFQYRTIPVLIALIVILVCSKLGFWQLSRSDDKEQRLAQIEKYQQYNPMSLSSLLKIQQKHDPTGVTVKLQGQFAQPYSWMLDNKIVGGKPGYDVLLALKVSGYEKAVLVNMGWTKGDYAKRDVLPQFDTPQGKVSLTGFVKGGQLAQFVLSEESKNNQRWPTRTQQINLKAFSEQSGLDFFDFVLYADQSSDFGFTHHYQPVVMPPEKHRAYALQWFLLALAALVIFIFASSEKRQQRQENNDERT